MPAHLRRLVAAGGDTGQIEGQQGGVGFVLVRFFEGGLSPIELVGFEKTFAE